MRSFSSTRSLRTSRLSARFTPTRAACTSPPTRTSPSSTSSAGSTSSPGIRTRRTRGPPGPTKENGPTSRSWRRRPAAIQDRLVQGLDLVRHPLDVERGEDLLPAPLAHRSSAFRVGQETSNLRGEVPRIHGIRQEAFAAVLDHFSDAGDVGDDHGFRGRHRLQRDNTERLEAGDAWHNLHRPGRRALCEGLLPYASPESDSRRDAERGGQPLYRAEKGTLPPPEEPRIGHIARGFDELFDAFVRHDPTDEEHDRDARQDLQAFADPPGVDVGAEPAVVPRHP